MFFNFIKSAKITSNIYLTHVMHQEVRFRTLIRIEVREVDDYRTILKDLLEKAPDLSEKLQKLLDPSLRVTERYRLKGQLKGPGPLDTKINDHVITIERFDFSLIVMIQRNFINFTLCLKKEGVRKFAEEWAETSVAA